MKWKHLLSLILFFQGIVAGFGQQTGLLNQAKALMQDQDYMAPLALLETCIEKDTAALECKEQAGLAAYRSGLMSKAKIYLHAIEKEPAYYKTAAITLSNIYEQQDNVPKAIKYNRVLRDSFPENPLYYRKIAGLLIKAALPAEAFAMYAKALELNPDDVTSIKGVAEIWIQNNQHAEADSLIRYGLAVDSTNVGLSLLQARNFYIQRQYDSTVQVLGKLRGRIDFTNYYNKMIGYSLVQIDSLDEGIYYLEKSLVKETDPEYAHYYLANAYELKGDMQSAKFHLEKAIETGTSQGLNLYHRNLARLQNEENNLKDAIPNYEWAYKYSKDAVLLFFLARAADNYYADKNIAINYYTRYINSSDSNEDYKRYARERKRYLREMVHQKGSN